MMKTAKIKVFHSGNRKYLKSAQYSYMPYLAGYRKSEGGVFGGPSDSGIKNVCKVGWEQARNTKICFFFFLQNNIDHGMILIMG